MMKNMIRTFALFSLLAVVACAKTQDAGYGYMQIVLNDDGYVTDRTRGSVSDYADMPAKEDFILALTDSYSSQVWSGRLSEWDPYMLLQAGTYMLSASSGSISEEGFGKPFFYGEAQVNVVGGETTDAVVKASLANTIIKIACTERFKRYYADYSFRLMRGTDEIVAFEKDDQRGAFVDGYGFELEGELTSEMKTSTFSREFNGLNPATAYTITIDIDNVVETSIIVKFNDTVEIVDLGDLELND